jgi:hypothetical protein
MTDRRRVFTPQSLSLVRQMAEQGSSAADIAKTIGSTAGSVRVMCSHNMIKLKRGRGSIAQQGSVREPSERSIHVPLVAHMPPALYAEFESRARDLHKPPAMFASMLLNAIAASDLYRAVLDE